jgi:hypothetical protein
MNIILTLLLFFNLGGARQDSSCRCRKAPPDEITLGSSTLVDLRPQRIAKVNGQVLAYGDIPLEDVLVEVFTRPDLRSWTARSSPAMERRQKRVGACLTGENGNFCISGIHAGKYELRVSKSGLTLVSGVIIVDPRRKIGAKLVVHMSMAI